MSGDNSRSSSSSRDDSSSSSSSSASTTGAGFFDFLAALVEVDAVGSLRFRSAAATFLDSSRALFDAFRFEAALQRDVVSTSIGCHTRDRESMKLTLHGNSPPRAHADWPVPSQRRAQRPRAHQSQSLRCEKPSQSFREFLFQGIDLGVAPANSGFLHHFTMQGHGANRMGLGMHPGFAQGQGPPIGSLPPSGSYGAYPPRPPQLGQTPPGAGPPGAVGASDKLTTLFVGSISAGVSSELLTSLFAVRVLFRSLYTALS